MRKRSLNSANLCVEKDDLTPTEEGSSGMAGEGPLSLLGPGRVVRHRENQSRIVWALPPHRPPGSRRQTGTLRGHLSQ